MDFESTSDKCVLRKQISQDPFIAISVIAVAVIEHYPRIML